MNCAHDFRARFGIHMICHKTIFSNSRCNYVQIQNSMPRWARIPFW
jgi:hypothetical protein